MDNATSNNIKNDEVLEKMLKRYKNDEEDSEEEEEQEEQEDEEEDEYEVRLRIAEARVQLFMDKVAGIFQPCGRICSSSSFFCFAAIFFLIVGCTCNMFINFEGVHSIHHAAYHGNPSLVQDWINGKYCLSPLTCTVDLDEKDVNQKTPLFYAAYNGHADVVRLLIDQGANVNSSKGFGGMTVLMAAVSKGHAKSCELLIDAGVDIHAVDDNEETALMTAELYGYTDIILMLEPPSIAHLHRSAEQGYVKGIQSCLDAKIDLDAEDAGGYTALFHAALNGHNEVLTVLHLLIQAEANINTRNDHAVTPLMAAAYSGHTEIVKLLIDNNADITLKDKDGQTALHWSCVAYEQEEEEEEKPLKSDRRAEEKKDFKNPKRKDQDHTKIVELLIAAKANVNSKCDSGWTPFHYARDGGHAEVVDVLLLEMRKLLRDARTKITFSLLSSAKNGDFEQLKAACEQGAELANEWKETFLYNPLEDKSDDGYTAIIYASSEGHGQIVKYLIEKGALVNAEDSKGLNALAYAKKMKFAEVALVLEEAGAACCTLYQKTGVCAAES